MSDPKKAKVYLCDDTLSFNVSMKDIDNFIDSLRALMYVDSRADDSRVQSLLNLKSLLRTAQTEKFWPSLLEVLSEAKKYHDEHQQKTQEAFNDLLKEVMAIEKEMMASFSSTTQALSQNTNQYDKQLVDYMGGLAQEINQANSLTALKAKAVEHLSKMRESIKERRVREEALLEVNNKEIDRLSKELMAARENLNCIQEQSKLIEEAALTCPLTSVANKRAMDRLLSSALADPSFWPFCLAVLDVDHFKHFNDNFGHQAGDKVLITMTQQVVANMRPKDHLFRYAGDEFVILFRELSIEEAVACAERIRASIEAIRFKYKNEVLRITISVGLTQAKKDDTVASLFERADLALLDSKRKSRNCVSIFEPTN